MTDVSGLGYALATVSYDGVKPLAQFSKRRKIGFTLLSDPDSAIIRAFDLLNDDFPPGQPGHGLSLPLMFVIDPKGIITHRFSDPDYSWRPAIDTVLNAIR
jgi:peroxiredoxin Q/BCP